MTQMFTFSSPDRWRTVHTRRVVDAKHRSTIGMAHEWAALA